jgi:hypothetical protein
MQAYDERLWPPVWLWVAGWLFAVSLSVSFYAALGPIWGLLALVVPGVLVSVGLVSAAARVRVHDGVLVAGPAHIGVEYLAPAEALDDHAARAVRGPESDPAGFHLIRGWIPAGIRAWVLDPSDPTPYWFVATRHPDRLAAAIEAARASGARTTGS